MSEDGAKVMWLPAKAQKIGAEREAKGLMGILGPSGVGKSHLVRQVALDPQFRGEVLVLMAEDSTATYGEDSGVQIVPIVEVDSKTGAMTASPMDTFARQVAELTGAAVRGERLPRLVFVDSISGLADYHRQWAEEHPNLSKDGERNKFADFWDLGAGIINGLIRLRDHASGWIVALATTTPPPMPELCVDGKMTPKNLTRLTSVCFFMTSEKGRYDPATQTVKSPAHRTVEFDEKGGPTGTYLDRIFTTQNTGEVPAKGHRNLGIRERAVLAEVLRKIHGDETREGGQAK